MVYCSTHCGLATTKVKLKELMIKYSMVNVITQLKSMNRTLAVIYLNVRLLKCTSELYLFSSTCFILPAALVWPPP